MKFESFRIRTKVERRAHGSGTVNRLLRDIFFILLFELSHIGDLALLAAFQSRLNKDQTFLQRISPDLARLNAYPLKRVPNPTNKLLTFILKLFQLTSNIGEIWLQLLVYNSEKRTSKNLVYTKCPWTEIKCQISLIK